MFNSGLGIDFGSERIKIAKIKKIKNRYFVADHHIISIPPDVIENNVIIKPELVFDTLKPIIEEKKLKGLRCLTSLSIPQVIVKNLFLPKIKKKELQEAIKWELGRYLHCDPEERIFDFKVVSLEQKNKKLFQVFLLGTLKENLVEQIRIIKSLGLKHSAVDFSPFALFRGLDKDIFTKNKNLNGVKLLLDFGIKSTRLYFFNFERLLFQQVIPGGISTLTANLINSDIFSRGEEDKELSCLETCLEFFPKSNIWEEPVFFAWVAPLIQELNETINYFNLYHPDNKVDNIILTGGGVWIKGLPDLLNQKIDLPINTYPFAREIVFEGDSVFEERVQLSLAIGLAVRGANGWN